MSSSNDFGFRTLFDPDTSSFTYLLWDESSHEAVLIDPVLEMHKRDALLLQELGLNLRFTLETHVHADHVTSSAAFRQSHRSTSVGSALGAQCLDRMVSEGHEISFGSHRIRVLETPGHTDDSLSFVLGRKVFTGDALLMRGCGRTDFQNGSSKALYASVTQKLFALPEEFEVHPAHDYRGFVMSTIAEEKKWNPRFAGKTQEAFVQLMASLDLPPPAKIHEAVPRNRACGETTA